MSDAHTPPIAFGRVDEDTSTRVAALYKQHRDTVYRLALRYGRGDRPWAEDVTQDVFVALCRTIESLDELEDLSGWFYRVTHNKCLSRLRRSAVKNAPGVRWLLRGRVLRSSDLEDHAAHRQGVAKVFEVVDALPAKQRLAFCMYHLDGKDQTLIGEILGYSKSYVCKLVKRAEDQIRREGWELPHD